MVGAGETGWAAGRCNSGGNRHGKDRFAGQAAITRGSLDAEQPKERSLARMSRAGATKAVLAFRPPTALPTFPAMRQGMRPGPGGIGCTAGRWGVPPIAPLPPRGYTATIVSRGAGGPPLTRERRRRSMARGTLYLPLMIAVAVSAA